MGTNSGFGAPGALPSESSAGAPRRIAVHRVIRSCGIELLAGKRVAVPAGPRIGQGPAGAQTRNGVLTARIRGTGRTSLYRCPTSDVKHAAVRAGAQNGVRLLPRESHARATSIGEYGRVRRCSVAA